MREEKFTVDEVLAYLKGEDSNRSGSTCLEEPTFASVLFEEHEQQQHDSLLEDRNVWVENVLHEALTIAIREAFREAEMLVEHRLLTESRIESITERCWLVVERDVRQRFADRRKREREAEEKDKRGNWMQRAIASIKDYVKGAVSGLLTCFQDYKKAWHEAMAHLDFGAGVLAYALSRRKILAILKAFGFSLRQMLEAILASIRFGRDGGYEAFRKLSQDKVMMEKLRRKVLKADELLDKYPVLKKATGLPVAGFLLLIWLNMALWGEYDYDFNKKYIMQALRGKYTLEDLLMSPMGLIFLSLFASGQFATGSALFHLSGPVGALHVVNLLITLFYISYRAAKDKKRLPEEEEAARKVQHRFRSPATAGA